MIRNKTILIAPTIQKTFISLHRVYTKEDKEMRRKGSKRADIVMSNLKREEWFKRYVKRKQEKEELMKKEKEEKSKNGEE